VIWLTDARRRGLQFWHLIVDSLELRGVSRIGEREESQRLMAKVPVHELRKLILPLETAVDAVLELDSEQGGALAFGVIVEAQIESEPEPGLALAVQRRGSEAVERRKFTLPVLAAAFIRYCWKCRIPLPRHGSKRIEIAPEGFVFTIEGSVEVIRRHGPLPQGQAGSTRREAQPPSAPKASESTASAETKPASAEPAAPESSPAGSSASHAASEPAEQAVA
jgi:hypothetical protein